MIDFGAERAVYQQLADILREKILSGEWPAGTKLPSGDYLTRTYGPGRGTIIRAMNILRSEGLIDQRKGQRPTVRDLPVPETVVLEVGSRVAIRMPTRAERVQWNMQAGVPVFVVMPPEGDERVYPGDRFEIADSSLG